MNYFLRKLDFFNTYPEKRFNQLIEETDLFWQSELGRAIEEVSGYLRARYDCDAIFKPLLAFNFTDAYVIDDRVLWVVEAYSEKVYAVGDYSVIDDKIYKCKTAILTGEAFDLAKWDYIAMNYSIFSCIADATGFYPENTIYFTENDTRNSRIVEIICDVVIYNLLQRLNNIDITVNRKERYDGNSGNQQGGAIGWLKNVSRGLISPNLPLIEANQEDQTGNRILFGDAEDVKTENYVF